MFVVDVFVLSINEQRHDFVDNGNLQFYVELFDLMFHNATTFLES